MENATGSSRTPPLHHDVRGPLAGPLAVLLLGDRGNLLQVALDRCLELVALRTQELQL